MDYSQKLKNFADEIEADFQAAINKAAVVKNRKFQMLVGNFIRHLNERYKRHCFIFNDSMGMKSIDCYHRVSGERVCWWTDCSLFRGESSISVFSAYRDLSDSDLSEEIVDFMKVMCEQFEHSVKVGFYFQWEGKTEFDFVEDKL